MKLVKFLCILIIAYSSLYAQQVGTWKNHTDLRSISDAVINNQGVWAASSGGAFYFNFEDSTYQVLNMSRSGNTELGITRLSAVAIDNDGKVWMGNLDGYIDVFTPETNSFKRIFNIHNTEYNVKDIYDLWVSGDTVYVSTAFGLSLINTKTFLFYDSFIKFGSFNSGIKVFNSFKNDLLYVCTESGIAKQKQGYTNLSAPESWDVFTSTNGLQSSQINKIISFRDTIISAAGKINGNSTEGGLTKYINGQWIVFLPELNGKNVVEILPVNDSLLLITRADVYNNNGKLIDVIYDYYSYYNGALTFAAPDCGYKRFFSNGNTTLFVATDNGLLNFRTGEYLFPDGPRSNNFINLDVDASGNLWVATGKDGLGVGLNKFDGVSWINKNVNNTAGILSNDFWRVYAAPDNKVYAGNWGAGYVKIDNDLVTSYSSNNTGLIGIPNDLNFVVIPGLSTDSEGNVWAVNFLSATNQMLSKLTPDSTWEYFNNPLISGNLQARELVIDQNNTKWFTIGEIETAAGTSLYYFNEDPLYSNDVNGWGRLSLSSSSVTINCLAVDRRGELWVGTAEGIFIITDVSSPKNSISQFIRPLSAHSITSIEVDALNQKWVGTPEGVYLLSADGTPVTTEPYSTQNSPLLNDMITSIAIDDKSGTVYIGTEYGMSSLSTLSTAPQQGFSELIISPNPVQIQNGVSTTITIDGLVRDSEIKILSISGKLLRTITTETGNPGGGKALWDGKDDFGNYVSSGIYLIVAYDKEGNNVTTGKVAILRK